MKKRHTQYARMAEELRDLRLQKDLTRKELASLVGCTVWAIRATEECTCLPKYDLLKKLAIAFGRPEDHFANLIDKADGKPEPKSEDVYARLAKRIIRAEGKQEPKTETVYPETVEHFHPADSYSPAVTGYGYLDSRTPFYWAYNFIKDLSRLNEGAALRVFRMLEDTLANPVNLKVDQR